MSFRHAEKQIVERNLRYLIIEMFWAAIFTGCVSFNAAYMIRLGGSNLLISLLTSGAALINALATMPFAALLERTARRKLRALIDAGVRPWLSWLPSSSSHRRSYDMKLRNLPSSALYA